MVTRMHVPRGGRVALTICPLTCRNSRRICRSPRGARMAADKSLDKSEVLKGTLDMLILKIVALGPIHGYAISQRIQQISKDFFQVQQGSLYPALHRLENRSWLGAEWRESETGREAKFYALTRKGRRQLETELVYWERLSDAVALILRTAE